MIDMLKKGTAQIKDNIFPILAIIGLVLFGYYRLFFGGHFYLYKDQTHLSFYSYGNSIGNGWRPEKGLGLSFFFGDPAAWHPWSIFAFWEKIMPSQQFAYSSSVVLLDILSAIALYFLLRRAVPSLGRKVSMLSVLAIFCPLQTDNHFSRLVIALGAGTPLLLMLLYEYYKNPKVVHLFLAVLLFWFGISFGTFYAVTAFLSLGLVFSVCYGVYFKERIGKILSEFLVFAAAGGAGMVLLGFWELYPMVIDYIAAGGYMREKASSAFDFMRILPDARTAVTYIASLFQIEWLPASLRLIGMWPRDFLLSLNVSAVFPMILIFFLFRRAENFWEFSFKWILLVFYIFKTLMLFPVFSAAYSFIISRVLGFKGLGFMYHSVNIFSIQVGLVAIFIDKMRRNDSLIRNLWGRRLQRCVASILLVLYSAIAVFCILALAAPGLLPAMLSNAIQRFSPDKIGGYPKEILVYVISSNVRLTQEAMSVGTLVFFLLTALMILPFVRNRWLSGISARQNTSRIITVFLISAFLLSWTIYPLSKEENVWKRLSGVLPKFQPTDRFYRVGDMRGHEDSLMERLRRHKEKAMASGGLGKHLAYKVGIDVPPALCLSGAKSFIQKNVGEFLFYVFNGDGKKRIGELRTLLEEGPVISSDLMDMGAVSYYYSLREIVKPPENLRLCFDSEGLYIYKNTTAWPYYYLAERLEVADEGNHLKDVKRMTAYVGRPDYFKLPGDTGRSRIELSEFSYGRLKFNYDGDRENLLIVADAWHPFWKAMSDGRALKVIKANEIFKGIRLPAGRYAVDLFFDVSPFYPGIYVSIVSWILFLSGLFLAVKFNRRISFLKRTGGARML